jgi:hypothetical protein
VSRNEQEVAGIFKALTTLWFYNGAGFSPVGDVMKSRNTIPKISLLAGAFVTALVLSTGAIAQHAGGGGGHFGGGGGHAVAGGHAYGGGYRGGYGYGGYRGGYGWHGGYYGGWRGGWGWGCCGWGWGWAGLGLGLYFATLPLYYQTYWWDGVPYYYANNNYYIYDPNVRQYETVAPPDGLAAQVGAQPGNGSSDIIAYPKNGQSADQQARDKFECHQWAASQSGVDPTSGAAAAPEKRNDYMRAQAACLEGRGYSVQ